MSASFFSGWMRGTLVGVAAFAIGVISFDVAMVAGLPTWVSAGLGAWALLIVLAVLRP